MKKHTRLWPALEAVGGLAATMLEWRALAGPEYPAFQPYLRPRQELATSYPCPVRGRFGVRHTIVQDGPDEYAGVCPEGCPEQKLSKADIVIYELNVGMLIKAVRSVLKLQGTAAPVDGAIAAYRLGTHVRRTGYHMPVFLALAPGGSGLRTAVDRIAALDDGTFALLAPTAGQLDGDCEAVLEKRRARFVALSDLVGVDGKGRLKASRSMEQVIEHPGKNLLILQQSGQEGPSRPEEAL